MVKASASTPIAAPLGLRSLSKHYGPLKAVDSIDLDVAGGEFVTFLGPSGSGKTTTLKMVAGFITPTSGNITIDGKAVTAPPHKRDIGMVFQNYALFPHMTAAQNVGFPLSVRRVDRKEAERRIQEALTLVELGAHGDRYPRQLSGGQQQRVALARALVFRPRVVLMDEPLGALDKKLRENLQLEIKRIQQQLNITMIYVTHDQEEALVMSDRIAVFNEGRIEQIASGEELYEHPTSVFVADFIGESNILRGHLDGDQGLFVSGMIRCRVGTGRSDVRGNAALVVRPERLQLRRADVEISAGVNAVNATVGEVIYLGSERKYLLATRDGTKLVVRHQPGATTEHPRIGDDVIVTWSPEHGVVLHDRKNIV
jgi:putative spermidine/putrescine transport system ATP-binding protein